MTKSKTMRWAGYIAGMRENRNAYRILVGKPKGKDHYEDQNVGGRTILKCVFER
jgi:hypothetical protein